MANWRYTVDVSDVFHSDMAFPLKRDNIVHRIERSQWYSDYSNTLGPVVASLKSSDNVNDFDLHWDELYDYADQTRAWIDTF